MARHAGSCRRHHAVDFDELIRAARLIRMPNSARCFIDEERAYGALRWGRRTSATPYISLLPPRQHARSFI